MHLLTRTELTLARVLEKIFERCKLLRMHVNTTVFDVLLCHKACAASRNASAARLFTSRSSRDARPPVIRFPVDKSPATR